MDMAPRETTLESGGYLKGVAIAIVTQNQDPEGLCRVKVSYPWHDKPRDSFWARIATPMAGNNRGAVFLPEVGDEVLVACEREDLRFPYVLGALWNGKDKPPETNADGRNDKRMIRSRKGHRLLFDDGRRGAVELALDDGKKVRLDDDGISVDDGKGNRLAIQSSSGALTIEAGGQLTLKGASVAIEASGQLRIKAGATLNLNGTMININ
jgi:uncharacterized protein involved in type VI secretion and phage assembly